MKRNISSQIFGGLVLIGIGAMFLLRQLGIADFDIGYMIGTYWPAILIFLGLQRLLSTGGSASRGSASFGSLIMVVIGVFFLGNNLEWFDMSAGEFFKLLIPVILIFGGLFVIFKPRRPEPPLPPSPPSPPGPMSDRSYYAPAKEQAPMEPPGPLESTLDEEFERKFGMPSGTGPDAETSSGPLGEDRPNPPGIHMKQEHAGKPGYEDHWRDKYERRRQERSERNSRRYAHWETDERGMCDGGKDTTNRSAFIGDIHMGKDHFQLKNTNISQFIGDTVLDLTNAQIPYGETKINLSAFIGDIKVYIPSDMDLGISVNSSSFIGDMAVLEQSRSGFMSSVQFKTPYYKEAGKRIRINVSAFIGDIKIKTVG